MKKSYETQEDLVLYYLLTKGKCSKHDVKHVAQYVYKLRKLLGWKIDKKKIRGVTTYTL